MNTVLEAQPIHLSPGFEHNPTAFLEGANYLDPEQPFDRLLIGLRDAVTNDTLPTAVEQRALIRGVKRDDLPSARQLVDSHQGIVAAVGFPFKSDGANVEELLHAGMRAVIKAAKTYDSDSQTDFNDYVVHTLHEDFSAAWPELSRGSFVLAENRQPMENVYHFAQTLRVAASPRTKRNMRISEEQRREQRWRPAELTTIPLLILPREEIIAIAGVSNTIVSRRLASIKRKFGVETKAAAVIEAYKRGIHFELPEIPARDQFTIRERQVATRLDRENDGIAEELDLSKRQVIYALRSLYKKTQARTRAELALMAYSNNFEPTEEELNPAPIPLPKQFSNSQQEIFRLIVMHPHDKQVADELNVDVGVVENAATRGVIKAGVNNRVQLFLELQRQGMEFDLVQPDRPITDILNSREIAVIKQLHLPYTEIAKMFSYENPDRIGNIINRAKKKVGVSNRYELALLVDQIEKGAEVLEVDDSNNRWRLSSLLGLKTLEACDIESLIATMANEQEEEYIRQYYLADEPLTWAEVSERCGVPLGRARSIATLAVQRFRLHLEAMQRASENDGLDELP